VVEIVVSTLAVVEVVGSVDSVAVVVEVGRVVDRVVVERVDVGRVVLGLVVVLDVVVVEDVLVLVRVEVERVVVERVVRRWVDVVVFVVAEEDEPWPISATASPTAAAARSPRRSAARTPRRRRAGRRGGGCGRTTAVGSAG
jgi:hypothetical protein